MKSLKLVVVPVLVVAILFQLACPKATVLREAQIITVGVKDIIPVVLKNLPQDAAIANELVADAQKIEDAAKAGDTSTVLAAFATFLPIFQQIVGDSHGLSTALQTEILTGLAAVDIAMHVLADLLTPAQTAQLARAPSAGPLLAFKAERVWGHDFGK